MATDAQIRPCGRPAESFAESRLSDRGPRSPTPRIGHSIQVAAATTSKHGAPYVIAVAMVLCGRAKDGHPVIFGRLV
jgi:hypothetical protein